MKLYPLKVKVMVAAMGLDIPEGQSGPWTIKKFCVARGFMKPSQRKDGRKFLLLPRVRYTQLWKRTAEVSKDTATGLPLKHGELVMQDTPDELTTHLDFMLRAHGKVLITGLGLGCVARGCLANPAVKSVTVIERDYDVIKLVEPHMLYPRLRIICADARQWSKTNHESFACAWHDLWSDPDKGEPHLQVMHAELLCNLSSKVSMQGCWAMGRAQRRLFRRAIKLL